MLPTLAARGDIVLAESLSVRAGRLRVGDVVVARSPTNPRHTVCKRVLGLGGDVVEVGEPCSPSPSPSPSRSLVSGGTHPPATSGGIVVPRGHAWLQGDNLLNSTDSRSYGPVPVALVRARVYFRAWPPSRAGRVAGGGEGLSGGQRRWYEQEYNNKNSSGDAGKRGRGR